MIIDDIWDLHPVTVPLTDEEGQMLSRVKEGDEFWFRGKNYICTITSEEGAKWTSLV